MAFLVKQGILSGIVSAQEANSGQSGISVGIQRPWESRSGCLRALCLNISFQVAKLCSAIYHLPSYLQFIIIAMLQGS